MWDPYYQRYIRSSDIQHLFNHLKFYNYPEIVAAFRRLPGFTKNIEKIFYSILKKESRVDDLPYEARERIIHEYIRTLELQNDLFSKRYREDEAADLAMYAQMYQEIIDTINPYGYNTWRTKLRINAIREMESGKIAYEYKSYDFSPEVEDLLEKESIDSAMFRFCYGNQLQQLLHREALNVLDAWGRVKKSDEQYDYQSTIAAGAEVSRAYNQAGSMKKAMAVLDFCWGLTAACVGGAIHATYQMVANPVATIAGISSHNYMLYMSAGMLLYDVCEIGYTALSDPKKAKNELHQRYIQPVEQIIDTIAQSEKGMVRATLEMGVACVSEYYTRKYLLGKLGKFYSKAKDRISKAIKKLKNGYDNVYATTPEGAIIESSKQFIEQENMKRSHFDAMNTQKSRNGNRRPNPPSGSGDYKFSEEIINQAKKEVMIENNRHHIYDNPDHKLAPLVEEFGSQEKLADAIIRELNGKINQDGIFKNIPVVIKDRIVLVRGSVVNGLVKIGTYFIE